MITDGISGYLLHKKAVGDRGVQLTLFTREKGLVRAYFNGKKQAKASLQCFMPLWMLLDERHYGVYIRQIESMGAIFVLPDQAIFAGLYVNELIYRTMQTNETDFVLFEAYERVLKGLMDAATPMALEAELRQFEWVFLDVSGVHVSYTHELDLVTKINDHDYYVFKPGEGFILSHQQNSVRAHLGAHVLAIAQQEWDDIHVLRTAKYIMRRAIDHVLDGQPLYSRRLYTHSNV